MDCIDRPSEEFPECWADPLDLYGEALLDYRPREDVDQWKDRDWSREVDLRWDNLHPW